MPTISEGDLTFQFPNDSHVGKYDDWAFYRNQFSRIPGTKAVDFVCVHDAECWLIEVKDYRCHPRTKPTDIADEVAKKARDTLAGLAATRRNAGQGEERALAQQALRTRRWRVALHLEQPQHLSRLRPTPIDPANVKIKLRKVLRGIDPHPVVADALHRTGSLGRRKVNRARVLDDQKHSPTVSQPGIRTK